jgi:hypothetical protein
MLNAVRDLSRKQVPPDKMEKLRKLLRLSKSDNGFEASRALHKAMSLKQRLEQDYGLDLSVLDSTTESFCTLLLQEDEINQGDGLLVRVQVNGMDSNELREFMESYFVRGYKICDAASYQTNGTPQIEVIISENDTDYLLNLFRTYLDDSDLAYED